MLTKKERENLKNGKSYFVIKIDLSITAIYTNEINVIEKKLSELDELLNSRDENLNIDFTVIEKKINGGSPFKNLPNYLTNLNN